MSLTPGTRLGTYHITGPLGAGGMGEVYRARDTRLGREVAIKVLPAAVSSSPDRLARFEREARTVAGLSHPNIVTLFSVEEEEGTRFLTMELVDGRSLDQVVTTGGLPLPRVLDLAIPLAGALSAAHERGVVHRDLKPGNVMVTHDGWVKVLDFGLAKIASEADSDLGATVGVSAAPISGVGQVLGTVPYMAPEQIRGETVDARSDLFALGIILYELVTGRRPFAGATPADVSSAILRDVPASVVSLRADLPRDLNRIISRCLEKSPKDRFQTARDVMNELRYVKRETESGGASAPVSPPSQADAIHSAPASSSASRPGAPATPTPTPVSRASSTSGTAASVVPGQDVPSIAVLPFVNRSRGEEDEYFSDGLADELLNVLTKIRGLRVAARASSFQFKGKNEDLAMIGEKLNVATLLDGSVRKAGNRVRISVQLIKAADRVQLWSETYDRSLDDIFAVQDDIAQSVVKELRTTLFGDTPDSNASGRAQADVAGASKGHGKSPEAHRLYLQGKFYIDRVNKEDTAKAIRYLQEAVALDPTHAAAWTELARGWINTGGYGWEPVAEGFRKAREAVARALEAQPDYFEAHVVLSNIQRMYEWDWEGAERSARRALELAPGDALAMRTAGVMAMYRKRFDEAERLFLAGVQQDPLNAGGYTTIGNMYRAVERHAEAEVAYRKALELAPLRVGVRDALAIAIAHQGRDAEAVAEANAEPAEWARLTSLAYVHHLAGRHEESKEALRKLEEHYAVDAAFQISAIYAAYGDVDHALDWLERARDQRDSGLALAPYEAVFRPLHGHPRWVALLKSMGLEA